MKLPIKIHIKTFDLPTQKNHRLKCFYTVLHEEYIDYKAVYTADEFNDDTQTWDRDISTFLHSSMKREHLSGVEVEELKHSWKVTIYSIASAVFTFHFDEGISAMKFRQIIFKYIHGEVNSSVDFEPETIEL